MRVLALCLFVLLSLPAVAAPPASRPAPGFVRVAIETSMGTITVAVDTRHARPTRGANTKAR